MTIELHHQTHEHTTAENKFRQDLVHNKKFVRQLDKVVLFVGVMAPFSSLPQLIQIIQTKNTEGVSLLMWVLYEVITVFWLTYGIAHREKPIIFAQISWFIIQTAVIAAILLV